MSTVDNRIVELQFNNRQFQNGISQSTQTLEKFNSDLQNLSGSHTGFDRLAASVDSIANKFSWFGNLAFQAMNRINSAILNVSHSLMNMTTLLANPFSGLNDGFQEFEHKMDSIQRIMGSVRKDFENEDAALAAINIRLDELNEYADKTIYSFKDMTYGVGRFTVAGMGLDKSVDMIRGLSNLAATAGTSMQELRRAMIQISQGLSSGVFRRQDWRSVENASLATFEFKNHLVETAIAMGTLVKVGNNYATTTTGVKNATSGAMNMQQLFYEGLNYAWLTSDIAAKALNDYGDVTTEVGANAFKAATEIKTFTQLMQTLKESLGSGWARSFENIIGNFKESKALWGDVGKTLTDMVNNSSDARNSFLELWKALGGREALIRGLAALFNTLGDIIGSIKEAFRVIFPPTTVFQVVNLSNAFADFMESIRPSVRTVERLTEVFAGLFAAIDILLIPFELAWQGIKALFDILNTPMSNGESIFSSLLALAADAGMFIVSIRDYIRGIDLLSNGLTGLTNKIKDFIQNFNIGAIFDSISSSWNSFIASFGSDAGGESIFTTILEKLKSALHLFEFIFSNTLGNVGGVISALASGVIGFFGNISLSILDFTTNLKNVDLSVVDNIKRKFDSLNVDGSIFGNMMDVIEKFIKDNQKIWDWFANVWIGFKRIVSPIFDWFIGLLKDMTVGDISLMMVANGFNNLSDTIRIFVMGLKTSNIPILIKDFLTPFKTIGEKVSKTFDSISKSIESFTTSVNASALRSISVSILLLVGALIALTFVDPTKLTYAIGAMTALFTELVGSFVALQKFNFGNFSLPVFKLIGVAAAIVVLATALQKVASIETNKFLPALGAIAALMTMIGVFMKLTQTYSLNAGALQLIAFGWAISDMANALVYLGSLSLEQVISGLIGIGGLFGGLYLFTKYVDPKVLSASGGALSAVAFGLVLLTAPIYILGSMDIEKIFKGIISIGGALLAVGVSLRAFPATATPKLLGLSAAMLLLTGSIYILGNMELESLFKGILSIAAVLVTLGIIAGASDLSFKSMAKLAGVITLLAIALTLLAIPIAALGLLSIETLMKGIVSIIVAISFLAIVSDSIKNHMDFVKLAGALSALAVAMTLLAVPIFLLGSMDLRTLIQGIAAMVGAIIALGFFGDLMSEGALGMTKMAGALAALAVAFTLLAVPIFILGNFDLETLFVGIAAMAATLFTFSKVMNKVQIGLANAAKMALGISLLAIALTLISIPILALGLIPWYSVIQGLAAVAATVWGLSLALKHLKQFSLIDTVKIAASMILLSVGITSLLVPISFFGKMDLETLGKGLGTVAIALGIMIAAFKFMPNPATLNLISFSTLQLAIALGVLVAAILYVGTYDLSTIFNGLLGIGGAIAILVIALKKMPATVNLSIVGLLGLTAAIAGLAYVVQEVGKNDLETLGKGLATIGLVLAGVWLFLTKFTANPAQVLTAAAGIAAIAGAMMLMVYPMKEFGAFNWDQVGTSLSIFAGVLLSLTLVSLAGPAAGGALIIFAIGVGIFALALWGLAEALEYTIPKFKEMIEQSDALPAYMAELGRNITLGILSMVGGVLLSLGETLVNGLMAIGNTLKSWWDGLVNYLFASEASAADMEVNVKFTVDENNNVVRVVEKEFKNIEETYDKYTVRMRQKANDYVEEVEKSVSLNPMEAAGDEALQYFNKATPQVEEAWDKHAKVYADGAEQVRNAIPEDTASKPIEKATAKGANAMDNANKTAQEKVSIFKKYLMDNIGKLPLDLQSLFSNMPDVLSPEVDDMLTNLVASIERGETPTTDALMNFIKAIQKSMSGKEIELGEMGTNMIAGKNGLSGGIQKGTKQAAKDISFAFIQVGDTMVMSYDGIRTQIENAANKTKWTGILEGALYQMEIFPDQVDRIYQSVSMALQNSWDRLSDKELEMWKQVQAKAKEAAEIRAEATAQESARAMEVYESRVEREGEAQTKKAGDTGKKAGKQYGNEFGIGFKEGSDTPEFKAAFKGYTGQVYTFVENLTKEVKPAAITSGKNIANGLIEGMTSENKVIFPAAAQTLLDDIKLATNNLFSEDKFMPLGKQIVNGIIAGIEEMEYTLIYKMRAISELITKTTEAALEIKSPSQVFKEIGVYCMEGFANGITSATGLVMKTITQMATQAPKIMDDAIREAYERDKAAGLLDGYYTISPIEQKKYDPFPVYTEEEKERIRKAQEELMRGITLKPMMQAALTSNTIRQSETSNKIPTSPNGAITQATTPQSVTMNNTFNVRNEEDARIISNKLGTMLNRMQYAKGVVNTV